MRLTGSFIRNASAEELQFDLETFARRWRISLSGEDAEDRLMKRLERDAQAAVHAFLQAQLAAGLESVGLDSLDSLTPEAAYKLASLDWATVGSPYSERLTVLAASVWERLQDAAQRVAVALAHAASAGVQMAARKLAVPVGGGVNAEAARWALYHAAETIEGMHGSTRRWVQRAVAEYVRSGAPQDALTARMAARLGEAFGAQRAATIAITEVTAAYYEGSVRQYAAAGVKRVRWETAADEKTCVLCSPMQGRVGALDPYTRRVTWPVAGMTIPAHPRCRCYVAPLTD